MRHFAIRGVVDDQERTAERAGQHRGRQVSKRDAEAVLDVHHPREGRDEVPNVHR